MPRSPIINMPKVVLILLASFIVMQAYIHFMPPYKASEFLVSFGLFPARFFAAGMGGLPGGLDWGLYTLISYSFVHGDWTHCLINALWFAVFGTITARLLSTRRFLLFYFLCVIFAGVVQIFSASETAYLMPIIGASGGVAGLFGAGLRIIYGGGDTLPGRVRLLPVRQMLTHRPALYLIFIYGALNIMTPYVAPLGFMSPAGNALHIAWQAHLGGFFIGLFAITWFMPAPLSPSGGPGNVDYGAWH